MDDAAAWVYRLGTVRFDASPYPSSHRLDDLREGRLHMRGLARLVLRPLPMESQHGNSPFVLDPRIDLAVRALIRDHLAATAEANERPVVPANVFLESPPVTAAGEPFEASPGIEVRHAAAASKLDVVAAREAKIAGALLS